MSHAENKNRETNHDTDFDSDHDPETNIGHKHPFVKKVATALRNQCPILPGQTVLAAVSGGADSVALLHTLTHLAPRRFRQQAPWFHLAVGHVQHHLRDDAESDAAFVESLAKQLGLPYFRSDITVPTQGNLENSARDARYDALASLAAQANAQHIATAHHGDDQLETLLMRILRGTSIQGLRGIAWRRKLKAFSDTDAHNINLIRPMLNLDRAAVLDLLEHLHQPWCEDHTNADVTRTRARLRAQVLPVLRDIQPAAALKATQLADHSKDVSQALAAFQKIALSKVQLDSDADHDSLSNSASDTSNSPFTFSRPAARQLPRVVLTDLLRSKLIAAGCDSDRIPQRTLHSISSAIYDQTGGRRSFELNQNLHIIVTKETVTISPAK